MCTVFERFRKAKPILVNVRFHQNLNSLQMLIEKKKKQKYLDQTFRYLSMAVRGPLTLNPRDSNFRTFLKIQKIAIHINWKIQIAHKRLKKPQHISKITPRVTRM